MYSPGNITHVANMVDARIFDDSNSILDTLPNIEFQIQAFLSNPRSN